MRVEEQSALPQPVGVDGLDILPPPLAEYLSNFPQEMHRLNNGLKTSLISLGPDDTQKKYKLYADDNGDPCLFFTEKQQQFKIDDFSRSQLTPEEVNRITNAENPLDAWVYKPEWRRTEKADPIQAIVYVDHETNTLEAAHLNDVLNQRKIFGAEIGDQERQRLLQGETIELRYPVAVNGGIASLSDVFPIGKAIKQEPETVTEAERKALAEDLLSKFSLDHKLFGDKEKQELSLHFAMYLAGVQGTVEERNQAAKSLIAGNSVHLSITDGNGNTQRFETKLDSPTNQLQVADKKHIPLIQSQTFLGEYECTVNEFGDNKKKSEIVNSVLSGKTENVTLQVNGLGATGPYTLPVQLTFNEAAGKLEVGLRGLENGKLRSFVLPGIKGQEVNVSQQANGAEIKDQLQPEKQHNATTQAPAANGTNEKDKPVSIPQVQVNSSPKVEQQARYQEMLKKGEPIDLREKKPRTGQDPRVGQTSNEMVNLMSVAFHPLKLVLHNANPFQVDWKEPKVDQAARLKNVVEADNDPAKKFVVMAVDNKGALTKYHQSFASPEEAQKFISQQYKKGSPNLLQPLVQCWKETKKLFAEISQSLKKAFSANKSSVEILKVYDKNGLQQKVEELQKKGDFELKANEFAAVEIKVNPKQKVSQEVASQETRLEAGQKVQNQQEVIFPKNAHTQDRTAVPEGNEKGFTTSSSQAQSQPESSKSTSSTIVVGDQGGVRTAHSQNEEEKNKEVKKIIEVPKEEPQPETKVTVIRGPRR